MKRAVLALVASSFLASPLAAQSFVSRDGKMSQAMYDTMRQNVINRGASPTDPLEVAYMNAVAQRADDLVHEGYAGNTHLPVKGWAGVLIALKNKGLLPWPFKLGMDGEPYSCPGNQGKDAQGNCVIVDGNGNVDFGGGGAGGGWMPDGKGDDCGDAILETDPQGNIVVPSYALAVGTNIQMNTTNVAKTNYLGGPCGTSSFRNCDGQWMGAYPGGAHVRRLLHLQNMQRPKKEWYGVVGPYNELAGCYEVSTVAYRNADNSIVGRRSDIICNGGAMSHGTNADTTNGHTEHRSCPADQAGSVGFHFYGSSNWGDHIHDCIWYSPNPMLGPDGYAIAAKASLPLHLFLQWPIARADFQFQCRLSPAALAKIVDAIARDTPNPPKPYTPITENDARPDGTTIGDLGDPPANNIPGTPQPTPPPATVPPVVPPPTGGTGGNTTVINNFTDLCDFGPTGCTDPGQAAELGEVPTGIMDPIFDWLPDLSSITINAQNSQCPVWNVNLTSFGGPSWQFLLESHCELMEGQREAIGVLMIALFGLGAGLIILRA